MNTGKRQEVLKLYSEGAKAHQIAKLVGLSQCRVGQILKKYCPGFEVKPRRLKDVC